VVKNSYLEDREVHELYYIAILILFFYYNTVKGDKIIPKIIEKRVGDDAEFMCISAPKPHWKFNSGNLPSNAKVLITSNQKHGIIKISHLKLKNAGRYSCTWINESGDSKK